MSNTGDDDDSNGSLVAQSPRSNRASTSSSATAGRTSWRSTLTYMALAFSLLMNMRLSNKMYFSSSDLQEFREDLISSANSSMAYFNRDAPVLRRHDDPAPMERSAVVSKRVIEEDDQIPKTNSTTTVDDRHITTDTQVTSATTQDQNRTAMITDTDALETVNVLFGMAGGKPTFIDEWEVALKSILLNAPLDAKLHIHILANRAARDAVAQRIWQKAALPNSLWRQPITITVYDVEQYDAIWTDFIKARIRENNVIDSRVTLGGYYRLLAHKVIPKSVGAVMYMDTDSVVMTNLNELWKLVDRTKTIQLALKWICSGFMILHLEKFDQFWDGLDAQPNITHGGDQSLVVQYARAFPENVGDLPEQWDAHLGNGFKPFAHKMIYLRKDGVGFLHFNGFRPNWETFFTKGLMQYCTGGCPNIANAFKFHNTWALADYYVRVTWPWVRYFGHSNTAFENDGYPLKFEVLAEGPSS